MVQGEGTWQLGNGGSSTAMGHGEGTAAVVVPWVECKAVCSSSRAQDVMGNVKQKAENALEMPQVWGCPALWVLYRQVVFCLLLYNSCCSVRMRIWASTRLVCAVLALLLQSLEWG